MEHEASTKTKVYLATAYSYKSKDNGTKTGNWLQRTFYEWLRFFRVTRVSAYWLTRGYNIFSPITHSHPIGLLVPERLNTHSMWLGLDFAWIDCCDELWVYTQPGWLDSYGVEKEIVYAERKGMPVRYVKPDGRTFL